MIKLIYGAKGFGKTKIIIDTANSKVDNAHGDVVFIADTDRYTREIKYQIRFVNTKESNISSEEGLVCFIKGLIAGNYDIREMYIDGASRMANKEVADMESFYSELEAISNKSEVDFTLTVSVAKENLPPFMAKYIKE